MSLAHRHEQVLTPGGFGCPDSSTAAAIYPTTITLINIHSVLSYPCEGPTMPSLLEARQVPDNGDPPLVRTGALQYRKP